MKLDVVVTDKSGKVIPGLNQQDFTVLDNKQPKQLLGFQAESQPTVTPDAATEVVVVIDEVNTSFSRIAYTREELKNFLMQNEGKLAYPTSLAFFSDSGTQVQSKPSIDGGSLLVAFDQNANTLRTIRSSMGIYGAEDRLQLSLQTITKLAQLEATKPGRKMVIWISPGWPILSGPRIDLSRKQEQEIFSSVVGLSTSLRQARITLYSIDPLGTADSGSLLVTYYEDFLKGVLKPQNVQIGNVALQVLAVQSGGLALHGNNSIVAGLNHCIADANAFYVLTVDAAPGEHPNEYHELQVRTATPGLTARTRTGYYAQP